LRTVFGRLETGFPESPPGDRPRRAVGGVGGQGMGRIGKSVLAVAATRLPSLEFIFRGA